MLKYLSWISTADRNSLCKAGSYSQHNSRSISLYSSKNIRHRNLKYLGGMVFQCVVDKLKSAYDVTNFMHVLRKLFRWISPEPNSGTKTTPDAILDTCRL